MGVCTRIAKGEFCAEMALFRKISKATSSQLEMNDSQQPGSDPGSQCPWVSVTSAISSDTNKESTYQGRKRYLCDLYGEIGAEKGSNWFDPSTRSCESQCFQQQPAMSFGKTETRLLREAYQRTADSMEAMQCQMRKMEMVIASMQAMVSRITERQDELFDVVQDLAVIVASRKRQKCCSDEIGENTVEKMPVVATEPSPGISPRMLSTPDVHVPSVSDLDPEAIPQPSFFRENTSPTSLDFQSEWLQE